MPEKQDPNLGLSYGWNEGESGWAPGMDKNLTRLGTFVGLDVISADLTAPPGSPTEGDAYIVASPATGAWAGQENAIAVFIEGAWAFHPPGAALRAHLQPEGVLARWDGTRWLRGETDGRIVESDGSLRGMLGTLFVGDGVFLVYTRDGSYDPNDGAIVIEPGRLSAYGAVVQLPNLTHSESGGLPLYVSQTGEVFLGPKPPNLWEQEVTDASDYTTLTGGTGVGAWVELTGLEITLGQNVEIGHEILAVCTLYIQEQSGNQSGTIELHWDASGVTPGAGAEVHATYLVESGQDGLSTQSIVITATQQILAGAGVTLYARTNNGSNPQYDVDLLGSLGAHVHNLKRTA